VRGSPLDGPTPWTDSIRPTRRCSRCWGRNHVAPGSDSQLMQRPRLLGVVQSPRARRIVAAVVLTVASFAIIGVVLLAATPIGCGPARAIGFKTIGGQCGRPVANHSPTPTPSLSSPSAAESPTPIESPSPFPRIQPPDTGPVTGSDPPFFPPAPRPAPPATPAPTPPCGLPLDAGPRGGAGCPGLT